MRGAFVLIRLRVVLGIALGSLLGSSAVDASDFDIVLSEIHYHPFSDVGDQEFIELYNRGGAAVDLGGWVLVRGVQYVFPPGTTMPPKSYLVVAADPDTLRAIGASEPVLGPWSGRLDNSGEVLALVSDDGEDIARLHWEDGGAWPERPDGSGPSLELADPLLDVEIPQHWYPSRLVGGTPGRPNEIRLPDEVRTVVLNEVASADASDEGFIELYNRSSEPVSIGGLRIESSAGDRFTIPQGLALDPGAIHVFFADELGFEPRIADVDWLLVHPDGVFADALDPSDPPQGSGVRAYGRVPDGRGGGFLLQQVTPGAPNEHEIDRSIVISEILYHPPAVSPSEGCPRRCSDPDQWIELHNRSGTNVALGGWSLSSAVDFIFPSGSEIEAGGYAVVTADRVRFLASHPGVSPEIVFGDWSGRLSHGSERLRLRDALGNEVLEIEYGDGTPVTDENPADGVNDGTFHGSEWPQGSQGTGRSIELIHPDLEPAFGRAWREGPTGGTPGAANAAFDPSPAPVLSDFEHDPPIPRSTESVVVSVRVSAVDPLAQIEARYEVDGGGAPASSIALRDDGEGADETSGDGIYTGVLPPQPAQSVVRVTISAETVSGAEAIAPHPFPAPPYPGFEGPFYLYQVLDDPLPDAPSANYWIIMTEADREELEDRPVTSDVLLPATFISIPGPGFASSKEAEVRHVVGIRFRGSSARRENRKSYRIRFAPERTFDGIEELNLNARDIDHELLGVDLFRRAGMPAPLAWTVNLTFAGDLDPLYLRKERVDEDFLERWFGGARAEGNLYRALDPEGSGFPAQGDLRWLGPDPEAYRPYYEAKSNEEDVDWTDIVELVRAFHPTQTPPEEFVERIENLIDVEQWARYFAIQTLLGNDDGSIHNQTGEDYFLYRIPPDAGTSDAGLWVLIPWDLEESFDEEDEPLFGSEVPAVRRFLTHERFAPSYWCELVELRDGVFSRAESRKRFRLVRELVDFDDIDAIDSFIADRLGFLDDNVPRGIATQVEEGDGIAIVPFGATWRYFRGESEPSGGGIGWTLLDFDDSSWESGPSGFGYGDGDDATVLSDMEDNYTTVYIRHAFEVADADAIADSLELVIDFDDGFIAYLNGIEVARAEMDDPGPAPFDATSGGHEAGTPESFAIDARGIIEDGTNVLAIQGVNADVDSTDFSLRPALFGGSGQSAGCGTELLTTGAQMTISGRADACKTRSVRIDGVAVPYDAFRASWSATIDVPPGGRTVRVETFDAVGLPIEASEITVRRLEEGFTTLGGTLATSTTLRAVDGPFLLTSNLRVPSGRTLTLEAGVEIFAEPNATIIVEGAFLADGDPDATVRLRARRCEGGWRGILFDETGVGPTAPLQTIRFAEIESATSPSGYAAGVAADTAKLLVEDTRFLRMSDDSINVIDGYLEVRRCEFREIHEGINGVDSTVLISDSHFERMIGDNDAIDFDGEGTARSLVERCMILHGSDDGIDLGGTTADIRDNFIFDVQDKAISIEGPGDIGASTITGNIIFRCGSGIALKSGVQVSEGSHNTIVGNQEGLTLFAKDDAPDGGHGVFHSTILWSNEIDIALDALSSLELTHSNVSAGVWPGEGNISADPLFEDVEALDFALRPSSPSIGTGKDGTDMGAVPFTGEPTGQFIRADSDANGTIDLTDAIFTLLHLFQGGQAPPCVDAADSNDDGGVDLSDPVHTLLFLFASGAEPPPPWPEPGIDPTPDDLSCE